MRVLVTFDVDGTLLTSVPQSKQHTDAIKETAIKLYNLPQNVDIKKFCNSNFSGTTDSWIAKTIIQNAMQRQEVTQEELDIFEKKEDEIYHRDYEGMHVPIYGVEEAIKAITQIPYVTIALCTGNYENIGWTKVGHTGLDKYFEGRLGGFGNILERKDILKEAIRRAEEFRGYKFDRIIHIGDAQQDVDAASANGCIPIAVETGHLKKEQFAKPCFVIPNMKDGLEDLISIIKTGKPVHESCIHQ
ncbi:haloacid dehalogenase-like hydrolase family protein [Trichomonas vaginalis G3]|uniref:Haloacid dehalogenase-like hydrolase family protein n=1 Tax=Trichomonas vaginalis (strain ATCC PRA-98 / G3) TaxID=412133 RepID=A2EBQ6_TRIV3|nr:HAD-hyrolase-like family [Trichomonas vaginalis G3]EAY09868.1 haloacid dehalogenase-like hydrolase family protein [Trichomonas vaginalis G3]KAI5514671.1 HAD-hyrolase-like family [Trichomonas vaginalis G3]|eukprot:XP_001322091.1 haloacid dehalogenase-like hydrolase family protein [Trichomonas vaginalis G3]